MTDFGDAVALTRNRGRVRSFAPFLTGQLATAGLTFIAGVLAARGLGPGGRGALAGLSIADEVSLRTVGGGLPELAGRLRRRLPGRVGDLRQLMRTYSLASVVVLLPGSLWLVRGLFDATGTSLVLWGVAMATVPVLGAWRSLIRHIAFADGRSGVANAILGVQWAVIAFGLLVLDGAGYGRSSVIMGSYLLGAYVSAGFALTRIRLPRPATPVSRVRGMYAEFGRSGVSAAIGSLGAVASVRLDQAIVLIVLGQSPAGLYAASAALASGVLQLGNALTWHSYGPAAGLPLGEFPRRTLNRLTLLVAVVALPAAVVAPRLISALFGHAFDAAADAAQVLLIASPLQARILMLVVLSTATGTPRLGAVVQLITVVTNVVLVVPFALVWDVTGAAAASALASIAGVAAAEVLLNRRSVQPEDRAQEAGG